MSNKVSVLTKLYEFYLDEFKNSGYHPHPANLLAMLILPEKNLFEPLKVCEGEFYKVYKEQIDIKINQVINDFKISSEEIKSFVELNGVYSEDEEYDKIWFVFYEGFGTMHGEIMYRPNQTDFEIYNLMDHKSNMYKMTENGIAEYKVEKRYVLTRKIDY